MKNIYSNIYSFNKKILKKTVDNLNNDNLVGLPTETVYGLAGNAYSKKAVNKIYELKKRPKNNPLIVHYHNINQTSKDVILNKFFFKYYKKYCPGPITFILRKKKGSKINSLVTANLKTVAIRFPEHRVTRTILKKVKFPIAMPSANVSSKLSPVTAYDVSSEFKKKLKIIINGGKCKIGIESTVIDLTGKPRILRPGIIIFNDLNKPISKIYKSKSIIKSPGIIGKHYYPGIPVILNRKPNNSEFAFITFGKKFKSKKNCFNLSKRGNLNEAASNLYATMRNIKNKGFKKIFVTKIPNRGAGIAINDRLKRASK